MQPRNLLAAAGLAACATITTAQVTNDVPLSNGGDALFFYSDPSAAGDLFWRTLPGDRLLAHQHGPLGESTMEVSGFYEELYDTDWSTSPSFFDRHIGPAMTLPGSPPCVLVPDLTGFPGTMVVIGVSGFASPCTVAPSLCSPSGCGTGGGPVGWIVDIGFGSTPGSGVVLQADGTAFSDAAVTYFVTPGMPATGGACGLGDYTLQTTHSTDETQADDCGGLSTFSGSRLGSGPLVLDPPNVTPTSVLGFREPVLNVVADSGTGLGVEHGVNGGGALNGLKLDTQSGAATIGVEVRDFEGVGDLVFVWSAAVAGGPPGKPLGEAWLLQRFSRAMPACFLGTIGATTFVFTAEGAFETCQIPQLPVAGPVDVYWQGLMHNTVTGAFRNTNRVRTTLY